MSPKTEQNLAWEDRGSPPVGSARRSPTSTPTRFSETLQAKGFAGGVPLNTETTAVKPRVGIAQITKRCLFFVEMARAGRALNVLPALSISAAEV